MYTGRVDIHRQIREIEKKAHQGAYGAWRKTFCRDYRKLGNEICAEAYNEMLRYFNSMGRPITCQRGCAHCCQQYVSISLSHGVVIVDYLYANEDAMHKFMRNYAKRRRAIEGTPESLAVLRKLEEYTTLSPVVRRTPQDILTDYANLQVPCPFLVDAVCAVYPVRPICCASHFSVSPPDWCRATSTNQPLICEATPSPQNLSRLNGLADRDLSLHQETLPTLIYRLLTEGLPDILQKLAGLASRAGQAPPLV